MADHEYDEVHLPAEDVSEIYSEEWEEGELFRRSFFYDG